MSSSSVPEELAGGKLLLDHPADGVARLTINNPSRRNALDHPILDGLAEALAGLDARCVILTGSEGMFSAGYDIRDIPGDVFAREAERLVAHPFTSAIEALDGYPYPTLAAIGGHAIGGGLEIAMSCDLRIAAPEVRMGMPPAKLGLIYSHTGIRRFIDLIGLARTRELFLVGRNIPADRALAWGMVNELAGREDLSRVAVELAAEVASLAPLAQRGNKSIIRALIAAEAHLDADTERMLVDLRRACFASEDFREGVSAFGERRPPRWQGR